MRRGLVAIGFLAVLILGVAVAFIAHHSGQHASTSPDGNPGLQTSRETYPVGFLRGFGAQVEADSAGHISSLSMSAAMSDEDWQRVGPLPDLAELNLNGEHAMISSASGPLKNLRTVGLSNAKVQGALARRLAGLPGLISLNVGAGSEFDLPELGDDVFRELRSLDLSGVTVTARAWDEMARMPKLETIILKDLSRTDSMSASLRKAGQPLVIETQDCAQEDLTRLEAGNPTIVVKAKILKTTVKIGRETLAGPPLATFSDAAPRPPESIFPTWLDGEMVSNMGAATKSGHGLVRLDKDKISHLQIVRVNQRYSDKKIRADVSFLYDGDTGVTGGFYYESRGESKLGPIGFVASTFYSDCTDAPAKDRLGGLRASPVRKVEGDQFTVTVTTADEGFKYTLKYHGKQPISDVELRLTLRFEDGQSFDLKRFWTGLKPDEQKTIEIPGVKAQFEKGTVYGSGKIVDPLLHTDVDAWFAFTTANSSASAQEHAGDPYGTFPYFSIAVFAKAE
jgi:hypothetical protein